MSIDSWEKFKNSRYIKKSTNTRLLGVPWRGSVWPVMKECDRKRVFVIVLFIIGHTRNRAQGTPLVAHPPRPALIGLSVKYLNFGWKFLQNGWKYPWFLLVSLVRPGQSLGVSGVLVRRPHHWVSCEYMNSEMCKHFSVSPLRPRLEPPRFPQLLDYVMCACLRPPVGLWTLEDTHQDTVGGQRRTGCIHSVIPVKISRFYGKG